MTDEETGTPRIALPDMCQKHQALLVSQCGYGPDDPWRALVIGTQIALFQGAIADPKVHAELGGDITNLPRLGCLACRKPDKFGEIIDAVQRAPAHEHIKAIKGLGEQWVQPAR